MNHPHLLFRQPNELSEGPLWDDRTQTLYWLDIATGTIWRARLTGGDPLTTTSWSPPEGWSPSSRVGCVGLTQDGSLVAGLEEGVALLSWGKSPRLLSAPTFDPKRVCYNDGKVGPDGAFWAGGKDRAHQQGIAPLERVTATHQEVRAEGLTISNGLDWSPDGQWFYLTDSIPRVIWRYRWDPATATITDRRVFADGSEAPGVADGLAVDAEGCVWSARWGGSQVVRLSPRGEVLRRVAFPVSRVSSCAFGGPDLKTLFVTTAKEDLNPDERRTEVLAGSVFALATEVPGLKAHRFGQG